MPGKVKGLVHWCKKVTEGYRGGEVTNMSSSWKNGLAFCALIHRFRPDLIDYGSLSPENIYENNELAYSVAEKEFGIMSLLDPKDMVEMACPDRRSVAIYVSQLYDYFKDEQIVEREVEYKTQTVDISETKDTTVGINEPSSEFMHEDSNSKVAACSDDNSDNGFVENLGAIHQGSIEESKSIDNVLVQPSDKKSEVVRTDSEDSFSDIDDILEANAALLQEDIEDIKGETELGRKDDKLVCSHDGKSSTDCDLCKEIQIPESINGTYKADAVLKAAVCAGIAAVAITAGGDAENENEGRQNDTIEKSYNEEICQSNIKENRNLPIPEIQITYIEDKKPEEEKAVTQVLVKSMEAVDNSCTIESVSPEVETKIKSMHQESIATSSSDSFQSAEYVITNDNGQHNQGKIYIRNETEKEDADQLVLVLADADSSAEITDAYSNSMKKVGSVSSESFTSTSSLASSDSSGSSAHGRRDIVTEENINNKSPCILTSKGIVPARDSETEIYVDEDDEEPPALPAVGPPPLPVQTDGMPFTQDEEIVIQGELEVLCAEPVSIMIEDSDKMPLHNEKNMEMLTAEKCDNLQASSIIDMSVSLGGNAAGREETSAQALSEKQDNFGISVDTTSLDSEKELSEKSSSGLPLNVSTINAETEKTVNPNILEIDGYQGNPSNDLQNESNFAIQLSLSESSFPAEIDNPVLVDKTPIDNHPVPVSIYEEKVGENDEENNCEIYSKGNAEEEKISPHCQRQNSEEIYDKTVNEETQYPIRRAEQESFHCQDFITTPADVKLTLVGLEKESVSSSEDEATKIKPCVHDDVKEPGSEKDSVKEANNEVSKQSLRYDGSIFPDKSNDSSDASKIAIVPVTTSIVNEELKMPSLVSKDNRVDINPIDISHAWKSDSVMREPLVSEPTENSAEIKDAVASKIQKGTDGKPKKSYTNISSNTDMNADVDLDLLKKAKAMSKRMAEKQIEIVQSPRLSEGVSKTPEIGSKKESTTENSGNQHPAEKSSEREKEKEETRSRRLEILLHLQKSTRPTKKKIEAAEIETSDSYSDSSADFKSKMKMWTRKSSTTQEPDEISSSSGSSTPDSASKKSFPSFPTSPVQTPSSPREDQSNLQKLTQSLPSKPRAGSVAEYVRKISQSSQCKPDYVTKSLPPQAKNLNDDTVVLRREGPAVASRDKAHFRRSTGTPGFTLSRPLRTTQPLNVSVKPLVKRFTGQEQNKDRSFTPPVPSSRPSRNSGDFSLIVKPLSEKYALSDEESKTKKQEEKKADLERKDSLSKRNPPKRNLSITRPRSRSGSRERNIWQHDYSSDVITSPAIEGGPSVARRDSFEVKVRPVSLQLSTDTSESANDDRRHSLSSGTSASEGNPKVNISVQALSPRSRATSESSTNELNDPIKLACDHISKSQSQAVSTVDPNVSVGAQERQSRPRTSLAPRWTSKVDNSQSRPNAEPLGIAARQPGRSVLNYVQSCLTQKTTPKSLQDKAAGISRPATFTNTDIMKPNIGDKRSVTGAFWSGNQPVRLDSVSICNSIFGSKAKMKIDKDRIDPFEKTHRNFSDDEADTNKPFSSENVKSALTSDLPSLSLDDEAITVKEAEIEKIVCEKILQEPEQKACPHEDTLKSKNIDKDFQDSCKDTPAGLEKIERTSESVRLPERDENKESMSESPRVLQSDEKSKSSSSDSSSSSDTDSEKDKDIKTSVAHMQIVKVETDVPQPTLKEIPKGAQLVERSTELNKADEMSSDKQSSISNASSIESIDQKRDIRITDAESEPAENNDIDPLKVRADVVSSVVHNMTCSEKTSNDAVESALQISAEENVEHRNSQTDKDELKTDIINQGKESGISEKLKATTDTLLIDKSDNSEFESNENEGKNMHFNISSPSTSSTSSAEIENPQFKEDSRMTDKKHSTKGTLEMDQSDESESESSESEDKVICHNVSSQSTSSTSLAEIEKPALKEDLKGIILELEKELVNESQEKDHTNNLQENDSCQIQIVDMEEPKVVAPASFEEECKTVSMNDPTMTIDQIQDETEDVSEKDLLEDFDNLVSSLKKEDDIFAKELDVVAEDETEDIDSQKKLYSSSNYDPETSDKIKKKLECDAESGNGWIYCQKDEKPIAVQSIPELMSVGKENDNTVIANEVVILPSVSHEKQISPSKDIEEEIVVHSKTTEVEFSPSSSSSSSSQSSSASLKEEVDDELLRNIIEDAQPFRAPLLEEIIESPKADKTVADTEDRRHQTCQPIIDNAAISGENVVGEAQEAGEIEVSCEDNNDCSDNINLVSVIRSDDPIILSAVADANDISSPLEVNVAVFEGSLQDLERMSPVLFPEEEVLKQHGFTDVVDEKLEDDLVLRSTIAEAKAEERKDRHRKKSETSSSDSSDTEKVSKMHAEKQVYEDSGTQKTKDNHDAVHSDGDFSKENLQEERKSEIQNSSSESIRRTADTEANISDREMEKMEMKDNEEMEKLEMKDNNLEEQTDLQSVQSENESEDGMKYKFRGKDGNCYLLLDNDPTSPVAKTLISMEKEKSENLKNSSLSSMSDEQIQDAIDSINLKHSEYIPVSGISVSLKNPEYFFNQNYDQFEVEFLEPQKQVIIETEPVDREHKILENEKPSDSQDIFEASVDIDSIRPDTCEFTDSQIKESESSEVGNYKQIKPPIQRQHPVSELDQGENVKVPESVPRENAMVNEAVVQYDPAKTITDNKDNDSVRHIQLSGSETTSSVSSSHKESKPHKKKKKRKTRRTKSIDSKNSNAKSKTEIKRSDKKQYTSSSESDYDGEPSSVSEKTIPLKKSELVNDKDKVNSENKACHEIEQDTNVQNVNESHLVNENYIELEFVKETVGDKSPAHDLKLSSEEREKLSDKVLPECNDHISDRSKTIRQSKKSESDRTSRSSSSSTEISESDNATEKKVVNIEKDIIRIDKAKSKVYHSDENLKSESSEESDLDDIHIIKSSEIKEPLGSEFPTKHPGAAANYENWPLNTVQLESNSEEINLDIDKTEDLDYNEEFLIGREKDPSKSEVARLIQQSLEQDRKRDEIRRLEQDRYKELQDKLLPRDEVLEHEHIRHLSETSSGTSNKEEDQVDLDESSQSGAEDEMEEMVEEEDMSEELLAGEATPLTMPSVDEISSPDEQSEKPVVEVFDLHESSGDDISPDMESQALFVKLKEAQCKNAVVEAEMAKLKAKIIVLENTEGQKRQYEKKCEEMAARLLEMEKKVSSARKEINHYQDMMEGSQGQYIALEKKMQGDVTAIEKKYHKAKKIIKEYQQREKDFLAERESLLQQQTEKDQQYNALVKSLKDRIFQLEKELAEAQRAAGLPVLVPPQGAPHHTEEVGKKDPIVSEVIAKVAAPIAQSTPLRVQDSGSPVMSPTTETASVSSESDNSVSEPISLEAEMDVVDGANTFEFIPKTELLDTSASRDKAQLASAIPSRRPPTKQRSKSQESIEGAEDSTENKNRQSGLESWTRHDRTAEYVLNLGVEDTVKKSDLKKRKAQQQGAEAPDQRAETPPPESLPPPPPPPSAPTPSLPDSDDASEHRDRQDSISGESSSTVSQTSYDPSKPSFRGMDSEIPASDSVSIDTTGTAGSGSSAGAAGPTFTKKSKGIKIPKLPFKFGGGEKDTGGVTLVSNRSLNTEEESEGGVTLISKKKLDSSSDFNDGASTISDVSSSYMVGELDEGGKSSTYNLSGTPAVEENPSQTSRHNLNQISSGAISQWNNENVCHWLLGIEMEKYTPLFKEKSITGIQLALLDANKLKAMGITDAKDRDIFKKKIKELKVALDKERKQMEKERKLKEKEQKARQKEQKKGSKKK